MNRGILFSLFYLCCLHGIAQNKIAEILNYDYKVKKVSIKSEQLAYVDKGSGEKTLLFIHGLSSNLEAWNRNISGLQDKYRCIALDLPGYGKSSKNRVDYSLADYADFLHEFIQEKNLEDVVLVGHSMGGQIAMHAALNYPQHFNRLVLIAPAGIETFTVEEAAIMKASYTPETVMTASDEQVRNNFKLNFHSFPDDAEFMVEDRIAMKEASDFETYSKIVVNNIHSMLQEPVIDKLRELKLPVLLMYGKSDLLIPNKYFHPEQSIDSLVEIARENIPNVRVKLIEEAGHFVNFEKPSEVNKEINDFLKHK